MDKRIMGVIKPDISGYFKNIIKSGILENDVKNLLGVNNKMKIYEHLQNVSETINGLAKRFGADTGVAVTAALLHDISVVIDPCDMLEYALNSSWSIDEAEKKYPFLLHQRISAVIAEEIFNIDDDEILSAIKCHTTLKANPSRFDMLLFLSDKISWDRNEEPPFMESVMKALDASLETASLCYMEYAIEKGMVLHVHSWFEEAMEWLKERRTEPL